MDPGLRGCGVAVFHGDSLRFATYAKNPERIGSGYNEFYEMANEAWRLVSHELPCHFSAVVCVVEMPVVYPGSKKGNDPNDLLALTGVGGAFVSIVQYALTGAISTPISVKTVKPAEWKGQVPKQIMNERVQKKLSKEELGKVVSVGALDHNTWDAVGIGLFALGRLR